MANNKDGDKDGKNVADIYFASRVEDIGTVIDPKASDDVIAFIKENVLGTTPFSAVVDNPTRHAELMVRKDALMRVPGYKAFASELATKPHPGVDKKSTECLRGMYHDFLREIRVLLQMYEAARTQGPSINADAHYRANGATGNAIRMSGLSTYLSHGEATAVSHLVTAHKANVAAAAVPAPVPAVSATPDLKRAREPATNQRFPCGYCGKPGHDAVSCRSRLRDENGRQQRGGPPPAPGPIPPSDADAKLLGALMKFIKDQK